MKKGDVVLVKFPFSDLLTAKLRPALVLVPFDEHGEVCLAFITSRPMKTHRFEVRLSRADPAFPESGLKADSAIRLNKIVTLHRDLVVGRIGYLAPAALAQVNKTLARVFNL